MVNCLWLVAVTLIFDGIPQIIIQRCQLAVPRWPNDINSADDNAILKNSSQNIECSFGCVARSTVLLKPKAANILLLNFCEQNFVQYGPITIAIICNGLSLLIFEKNSPSMPLGQNPHQTVTRFGCVGFSMYVCGFSVPQRSRSKWAPSEKMKMPKSASSVSRSQAHLKKRKRIGWSIGFNYWLFHKW